MVYFAVLTKYETDSSRRLEVRQRHRTYLTGLRGEGVVVAAGPWSDQSGALLIYAVTDRAELAVRLAEDPYVSAGVIDRLDIREWVPVAGVGELPPASPPLS